MWTICASCIYVFKHICIYVVGILQVDEFKLTKVPFAYNVIQFDLLMYKNNNRP